MQDVTSQHVGSHHACTCVPIRRIIQMHEQRRLFELATQFPQHGPRHRLTDYHLCIESMLLAVIVPDPPPYWPADCFFLSPNECFLNFPVHFFCISVIKKWASQEPKKGAKNGPPNWAPQKENIMCEGELGGPFWLPFFGVSDPSHAARRGGQRDQLFLASPGLFWPLLASPGLSWPLLAFPGLSWPFLAFPGLVWPLLASPGLSWPFLASSGLCWPFLVDPGFSWPLLGLS